MKEEKKHARKGKILIRILVWTAFAAGLFAFFVSPFAIRTIWLPLAASQAGAGAEAESAKISLSRTGLRLSLSGFRLTGSDGFSFSADRVECKVGMVPLLAGICNLDAIRIHHADVLVDLSLFPSREISPDVSKKLKIGAVDVDEADVLLISGKGNGRKIRASIRDLTASGFLADAENTLNGQIVLYPGSETEEPAPQLLFRMECRFHLDSESRPIRFFGSLSVEEGKGKFFDRPLDELKGAVFLEGKQDMDQKKIFWKANAEGIGIDCTDKIGFHANGFMDSDLGRGSLRADLSADFSDTRLSQLYFSGENAFFPCSENLRLLSGDLRAEWNENGSRWDTSADFSVDSLRMPGYAPFQNGILKFRKTASFSPATRQITLQHLSADFAAGSASASLVNHGDLIFSRNENGYHVQANNAGLTLSVRDFPVAVLNSFLPFHFGSGFLSMEYKLTADSAQQCLAGTLSADARGVSLTGPDGNPVFKKNDLHADLAIHSKGMENITGFVIDGFRIRGEAEGTEFFHAALSGFYHFQDAGLSLDGSLELIPYELAKCCQDPFAGDLCRFLRERNAETMKNIWQVKADFDPARSNRLSFQGSSQLDTIRFLCADREYPVSLHASGYVERTDADPYGTLNFDSVRFVSPETAEISAEGKIELMTGESDFTIRLHSLSPDVLRGAMRLLFTKRQMPDAQVALFNFLSLTGKAGIRFRPSDGSLRISPFELRMKPAENAEMTLSLERDVLCFWNNVAKSDIPLSLHGVNIPAAWFEFLIPPSSPFHFLSGRVNGSAEVTVRNFFENVYLDHDILAEGIVFRVMDAVRQAGDCRISGKTRFTDWFYSYDLFDVVFRCLDGNREYASVLVPEGSLGLAAESPTRFRFELQKGSTSPSLLYRLGGPAMDSLLVRAFDVSGSAEFNANADYSDIHFSAGLSLNRVDTVLGSPSGPDSRPLHGTFRCDLRANPDHFAFRENRISLADEAGRIVFDLSATGTFARDESRIPVCELRSEGIDGEYLLYALTARKRPSSRASDVSGAENDFYAGLSEREKNALWPFYGEPPALSLYGYRTHVNADLRNLSFTRYLQMSLKGSFSAVDGLLSASGVELRVNNASAKCEGKINTAKDDGWEYEGVFSLSDFDVSAVIGAIASVRKKDFTMKELKGILEKLEISFRGKGLSLQNLERNFSASFYAKIRSMVIPFAAKDSVSFFRILILPIEYLPRLIDMIPQKHTRVLLQKALGDDVDLLSGRKNLEFDEGEIDMTASGTPFRIRKMYFIGPQVQTRIDNGFMDFFYNEMDVNSLTRFSRFFIPLRFYGSVIDPQIDYSDFLLEFFKKNTIDAGRATLSVLSLGLAGKDSRDWKAPADAHPPQNAAPDAKSE